MDKKQDELIEQLKKKNQEAITSGLEDLTLLNQLPAPITSRSTTLPIDKPAKTYSDPYKFDLDTDSVKMILKY